MSWPSRYGTLGESIFGKEDPFNNDLSARNVIEDTMTPLKHPVTGEVINSKTKWAQVNRDHGLEVVGNDIPKYRHQIRDRITDDVILDRIQRAEAIYSDPAKLREAYNRNQERLERRKILIEK